MLVRVILGLVVFAILIMIIGLEFSFPGFVNNYWSPIVSTILTGLLAWLAYLSYRRDEPRFATELNLLPVNSPMVRDQFGMNDKREADLSRQGVNNLLLIVVTNQSKNPAVIRGLVGDKELFVPLVDVKFAGFGTLLKEGEQKIKTIPLDKKLREQILASRYLAVEDVRETRHKCKSKVLRRLKKQIKGN